jgi:cytochrome P450
MGRLYNSMVGAVMNESLRLMQPIIDVPKIVRENPQPLTYNGKTVTLPPTTFIHLSAVGVHRNPRYWPHSPSKISNKVHDLDDFIPERWLRSKEDKASDSPDSKSSSRSSSPTGSLYTPQKGTYIPFSEGARSCPGKRFAHVEITAALAAIFHSYSIELDVSEWASDSEVEKMGMEERKRVYEVAKSRARKKIGESETVVTLQMPGRVGVRFCKRGGERFMGC